MSNCSIRKERSQNVRYDRKAAGTKRVFKHACYFARKQDYLQDQEGYFGNAPR